MIHAARLLPLASQSAGVGERLMYRNIRGARMACREFGPANGPVVICVHGLSANSLSFLDIAKDLAARGYHVVVPDLRGRNLTAASGDLGWENHARDMLALADDLGAQRFTLIGHSMGAYIGMKTSSLAPARLENLVLIDSLGLPESFAASSIGRPTERFERKYASVDEYVAWNKAQGHIDPFTDTWERMYREEVEPAPGGGVRPRTSGKAVETDSKYAVSQSLIPGLFPSLWQTLPDHTLVIRAGKPLAPVLGNIISQSDLVLFGAIKPTAKTVTVPASHFNAVTDPNARVAIRDFLPALSR